LIAEVDTVVSIQGPWSRAVGVRPSPGVRILARSRSSCWKNLGFKEKYLVFKFLFLSFLTDFF